MTSQKPRFNEETFLEEFTGLIADGKKEPALKLLHATMPLISTGGLNRMEKLKHYTFAGRLLQSVDMGKYGPIKLQRKARATTRTAQKFGLPGMGTFVDFGCGAHEPLGLAAHYYGLGFERAIGNDFLPVRVPEYAALSMYDNLSYMQNFTEDFVALDQTVEAYRARIGQFDLKAFHQGDYWGGVAPLADTVEFKSCDIVEAGIPAGSVSYLISFAVFEHVMDMKGVLDYLFEITQAGGLHRHYIDLADHRAYRHDGVYNRFSFLTEEDCAPNLNRLRASEQIAAFQAAGFELLEMQSRREEIPAPTRAKLLSPWKEMTQEDQETYSLSLTLRKPG